MRRLCQLSIEELKIEERTITARLERDLMVISWLLKRCQKNLQQFLSDNNEK